MRTRSSTRIEQDPFYIDHIRHHHHTSEPDSEPAVFQTTITIEHHITESTVQLNLNSNAVNVRKMTDRYNPKSIVQMPLALYSSHRQPCKSQYRLANFTPLSLRHSTRTHTLTITPHPSKFLAILSPEDRPVYSAEFRSAPRSKPQSMIRLHNRPPSSSTRGGGNRRKPHPSHSPSSQSTLPPKGQATRFSISGTGSSFAAASAKQPALAYPSLYPRIFPPLFLAAKILGPGTPALRTYQSLSPLAPGCNPCHHAPSGNTTDGGWHRTNPRR